MPPSSVSLKEREALSQQLCQADPGYVTNLLTSSIDTRKHSRIAWEKISNQRCVLSTIFGVGSGLLAGMALAPHLADQSIVNKIMTCWQLSMAGAALGYAYFIARYAIRDRSSIIDVNKEALTNAMESDTNLTKQAAFRLHQQSLVRPHCEHDSLELLRPIEGSQDTSTSTLVRAARR